MRGGDGHFDAKFVLLACPAVGNILYHGRMLAVEVVLVFRVLGKQAFDSRQNGFGADRSRLVVSVQFSINVAQHPADQSAQGFERRFHPQKLSDMGVASLLNGQARGFTIVVLA